MISSADAADIVHAIESSTLENCLVVGRPDVLLQRRTLPGYPLSDGRLSAGLKARCSTRLPACERP
jgi:hypothetical protein